jgi:hypothetical protein
VDLSQNEIGSKGSHYLADALRKNAVSLETFLFFDIYFSSFSLIDTYDADPHR